MQVRYQAAPRSDEPGILPELSGSATDSAQYFQNFGEFLAQRKCARHIGWRDCRRTRFLRLFKLLACAAQRETLFVQQLAYAPYQLDFVILIIASVAAPLDWTQLGKFLLPVTQHVRFDRTQFGHFAYREVTLVRNRRQFTPGQEFQGWRLLPGISVFDWRGTSRRDERRSAFLRRF